MAKEGVVKEALGVPASLVKAGVSTETQILIGPDDGAPNFVMRRFVMGVGGGMPRHTNLVEHEQFVVRGKAAVAIGNTVHHVSEGDALLIPGGIPHSYEVKQAPFEFLCIVPNNEDKIELC